LYQELNCINELYPQQPAIVCVDDYRLWNKEPIPHDWQHITNEKLVASLSRHKVHKAFEINDRMYILINF
jgi:hypothetical protein